MPRIHEVIMSFEGECKLCGGCCHGCDRLYKRGKKWLCRDHPDRKPSHCILFPLGYSVELLPETCALRPTSTMRVDEVMHTGRIVVSGRTSLVMFHADIARDDEEASDPTLYDLQGKYEAHDTDDIYDNTPAQHIARMRAVLDRLVALERDNGDAERPLSWDGARESENAVRDIIKTAIMYGTRRDIIVGDLFRGEQV